MDPSFWALRSADKILLVIVTASVYWGIGNDFSIDNFNNLRAALAAWAAFGAASAVLYVPSFHAGIDCSRIPNLFLQIVVCLEERSKMGFTESSLFSPSV